MLDGLFPGEGAAVKEELCVKENEVSFFRSGRLRLDAKERTSPSDS